jgi:hypothetical protein
MPLDPNPFQHLGSSPPPEPSTSGSRHDPIILPDDQPMWDSDNEDLQEIMQEACHDARKSPPLFNFI